MRKDYEVYMKTVLKNFIYNTGYQLLTILIPIITTPYLARIIGAEGIGKYSYANSIAYYFVMFIMLGLNNYGNRTIAGARRDKKDLSKKFHEIYLMQLIIGVCVLTIYVFFCYMFKRNDLIQWLMVIYVLSAIFDINWFFFGMEQFKLTVTRNIIIKLLSTVCIFGFVRDKKDIYIYILISLLSSLISNLVLWTVIFKYVDVTQIRISDSLKHIKPNLILFIPIVAVSLYKYMDKIMLGLMSNMEQVGYYEYSEKIIQIPIALVNSLGTVMLPKMSNIVATGQKSEEKRFLSGSIILAIFCSSSICFGLMGIAKEFVPVFYGSGFDDCVILFYILLPSCCFIAFASVIRTQYLIPHKKDDIYIKSVLLGALVNFVLNIILIKYLNSKGAAIATLVAEMMVCVYQCIKTKQDLDIKRYVKNSIPFVAAGIVMFAIIVSIPIDTIGSLNRMFIKIIIGIIIYFVTLMFLLHFNKNELMKIEKIYRKFVNHRREE